MSTAVAPPDAPKHPTAAATIPAEQRVILHDIPWETYVALCDAAEGRGTKMCYDRGTLEIMSPGQHHEELAEMIAQMVRTWAEIFRINTRSTRSMTCRNESEERGFEGDASFYILHHEQIRGISEVDLSVHPAPDLVIEVDISRSSRRKFAIYESLGVLEVWLFDGERIHVHVADDNGKLQAAEDSRALPGFPLTGVNALLDIVVRDGDTAAIAAFRKQIQPRHENQK